MACLGIGRAVSLQPPPFKRALGDVQDIGRFFWDRDEIRSRLEEKMATAFDRVWDLADSRGVTPRAAALANAGHQVAIGR